MSYGTPAQSGPAEYSGSAYTYATDEVFYGADIRIDFKLSVNGVAQAAPNPEVVADPNFQSFLDHVAAWEGFTNPTGSGYTTMSPTEVSGGKTYPMTEEVSPE
jgi:hypothetical protein